MLPEFSNEIKNSIPKSFVLIYECLGQFDQNRLSYTIENLKSNLKSQNLQRSNCKRVFGVIVESLENAFKHSVEQNKFLNNKVNLAVFLLKQGNNFKLIVGNYINADAVEKLKKKFEELLQLPRVELQENYLKKMNAASIDTKGGGGLGILDIAIRSEGNIITRSIRGTKNNDFFVLEATIEAN